MSNPLRAVGQVGRRTWRSCPPASTPVMSSGRWIVLPSRCVERAARTCRPVGLEQRVADRLALRGEEREAHRAADHDRVDDAEQRLDDAELVGDLGAAEHGDERALRLVAQAEQDVDLLLQQPPHRRRHELRRPDDRGVGAMRGAERVVDVGVDAVDELRHERRVVALLARIEAQVLEQLDARRQLGEARAHRRPSSTSGRARPSAGRGGWRTTTCAPRSVSHSIVGSAARMRKSSVIVPSSSSGTLKSVRTRTRFRQVADVASRSSRVGDAAVMRGLLQRLTLGAGVQREVDEAVRVAPLVVVPAVDLDQLADALRQAGVEDARVRVADDVARHDRLLGVAEDALELLLRRGRECRVDRVDRRRFLRLAVKSVIDPVGTGTRNDVPSSLPFIDSITSAVARAAPVARRDDVDRRGPGPAQVGVRPVDERLVAGVGVDRRHQALTDAERVVEHLDQRHEAVGRAARVGDHLVLSRSRSPCG